MILAVTPNRAVDRTVMVDHLRLGSVNGGAVGYQAAGGKGLNVARAIHSLGVDVLAMGPIGGTTGANIETFARDDGLQTRFSSISGESRTCTILADSEGSSTVVNEVGPNVSVAEWESFVGDVSDSAAEAACVTISGSLPGRVKSGSLLSLSAACPQDDGRVWIDCGPAWMGEALESGRSIKVNHHEAARSLGLSSASLDSVTLAMDAARTLVDQGANECIVTLGDRGAVWAKIDSTLFGESPRIDVVNSVGSGDSFLAGLVVSIERGESQRRALAVALASGAVNAMQSHAGRLDRSLVDELALDVVVT